MESRYLAGIVDGMRCGIIASDREGRLILLNEVARQILALPLVPDSGTPLIEVLAAHPSLARVLRESFEMANLPNRAELNLDLGSAGKKTIGFTLSMIPGCDGVVDGAALFFKDLTQIEHKEERERLRDRLAALGEMAASLAHEIRNPLASIEVSCALLKRRLESIQGGAEVRELLAKVAAEVQRLNNTITSSLEFVRLVPLNPALAELPPLVDEAITVASRRVGKNGIAVETRYEADIPEFLMDRRQLRQVFENLVLNAMEAIGDEGRVRVEIETRDAPSASSIPYPFGDEQHSDPWQQFDRFAIVRVRDTGPGIDEEQRSRIFYPFYTTKKQGSGVGLPMAKKIVNSHHGLIDVENDAAGGAVFTVRLPMVLSDAEIRGVR